MSEDLGTISRMKGGWDAAPSAQVAGMSSYADVSDVDRNALREGINAQLASVYMIPTWTRSTGGPVRKASDQGVQSTINRK